MRFPRDHVFSQYEFCKSASDPSYRQILDFQQSLPGQKNYHLKDSFEAWITDWYENPRWGWEYIYNDYESCYCPYNLQTVRLACDQDHGVFPNFPCFPNTNLEIAQENLQAATIVGVVEAYHETFCLFHAQYLESLTEHCNCESPAWDSYNGTKDDHGVHHTITINDMPEEIIQIVDEMTKQDVEIYKAAIARFVRQLEDVEERFGQKILCQGARHQLYKRIEELP